MDGDGARGAVVVTGSSTGIGRACALQLDRLGFKVFAGVRREADGERLRAEASERLEPLILDVTDSGHISRAAERVSEATEARLAGLVNNAGIGVGGPLELLSMSDFRHQIEVNLIGQVAVTQAFIPALRRRSRAARLHQLDRRPDRHSLHVSLPRFEVRDRGGRRRAAPGAALSSASRSRSSSPGPSRPRSGTRAGRRPRRSAATCRPRARSCTASRSRAPRRRWRRPPSAARRRRRSPRSSPTP